MGELLLELLSEEIPARMQRRALADLTQLLRDKLAAAEVPAAGLTGYVTPRRLAVIAAGIPATQPDRSDERRGPRVGAPQPAIDGFLRAAGIASLAQCEIRDTGKGEFYFAVVKRAGRPSADVLPELIKAAMSELPWPKSMRYPASTLRWVRPLISVICLFDGDILAVPLDQVPVGRVTRGHRFMAPGEITVADGADYLDQLAQAYVILDHDRRREMIRGELDGAAAAARLSVKPDPGLLDEVAGLVEFPVVLIGAIDADFMTLPPEVLATAMRIHQKYFSVLQPDGAPAPHFLFVANNLTPDSGATIIAGNERVLRARLSDARFFWDQDRKVRLEDRVGALKQRVFHAKLGSVYDKVQRVESIAQGLATTLGADANRVRRAARLAKADLSTGIVGEFPELQGVMGRYYALHDGEDAPVADAIADHYKPLGPGDTCPNAPESVVVALADKIDSLAAFFAIDEKPTGSRDPFALRRAALGIIRIILDNKLRLPLSACFGQALEILPAGVAGTMEDRIGRASELLAFIADRLKVHLRAQGVRHDLIAAAFAQFGEAGSGYIGRPEDDLVRLIARVDALDQFLATDDGANLLTAYRRAANIVGIEERRDGRTYSGGHFDRSLLCQAEEAALADGLDAVGARARAALDIEAFEQAMAALARLRQPVDAFFDKVTVNDPDAERRRNRLCLLSRIRATLNQVADFSQIEG